MTDLINNLILKEKFTNLNSGMETAHDQNLLMSPNMHSSSPNSKSEIKRLPKKNTSFRQPRTFEDKKFRDENYQKFKEELHQREETIRNQINNLVLDVRNGANAWEQIKVLEKRLYGQRVFLNMVVHDLRSPTESIHHGLQYVLSIQQQHM